MDNGTKQKILEAKVDWCIYGLCIGFIVTTIAAVLR